MRDPDKTNATGGRRRETNTMATRDAMISAGRAAFSERGFAGASLEQIVVDAGVTTGALYHHFGNKKALFQAVAESIEQEILEQITAQLTDRMSGWEQLERGLQLTFELCTSAGVHRILFSDAPNVIGMRTWRDIELQYGFGLMHQVLEGLRASGEIKCDSIDLTARILLGGLIEAVHAAACADDSGPVISDAKQTLMGFIEALRSKPVA